MERLVLGEIGTNCYIVPFDGKAIVIDPGDNAALIIRRLADLNLAPSHFLLTHGHFDHLAALPALFRHYQAAGVKTGIAIHKDDAVFPGRDAYKARCDKKAPQASLRGSSLRRYRLITELRPCCQPRYAPMQNRRQHHNLLLLHHTNSLWQLLPRHYSRE